MPTQKKRDTVSKLTHELASSDAVVLSDYTGLTHQQLEQIRRDIKKAEGVLRVVKNSLLKIALKEAKMPGDAETLGGSTAVLFAKSTNLNPLKILHSKGAELETFKLKWGIWDKSIISIEQIIRLATLPSRETLLAQLAGQLKSPQARLVWTLKGNLQKLVIALEEIRKKKEALVS